MTQVLFLCARNDARSQMAAAFARTRAPAGVTVRCAGSGTPAPLHPLALRVMAEIGIDIAASPSRGLEAEADAPVDIVINLGGPTAPLLLPGRPEWVHWDVADPDAVKGAEDIALRTFRDTRDRIRGLVDDFFSKGYLAAFVDTRARTHSILNSISDGIMVTDGEGRVMYFNKAAEAITGYGARAVLNQSCTLLFPESCLPGKRTADAQAADAEKVEITLRGGERRLVYCRIVPVRDAAGRTLGNLLSFQDVRRDRAIERQVAETARFSGIIGRDEKMLAVFELIRELADVNVPVLIEGESGTGKELVAAAIHHEGPRRDKLFVPVNCGALPESLLESELFGHVKGAFTGAIRDKKGRFELADGGTIFLDEIGDISPAMQVKLLRVLQEGTFERVGSEQTIKVDVRIVSATNKELAEEIREGRFREDLYYRLSVVPIQLPPLRERKQDIPLLVDYLLAQIVKESTRRVKRIAPAAMDAILAHDWPGNVRELQNWLQFALVKCHDEEILPEHLPPNRRVGAAEDRGGRRRKLTEAIVREALQKAGGNKLEAARDLGIARATLYRFLEESGLEL